MGEARRRGTYEERKRFPRPLPEPGVYRAERKGDFRVLPGRVYRVTPRGPWVRVSDHVSRQVRTV